MYQLPEMVWAGPTKPVFQPTVRAMWAGTMLVKRLRQSVKVGLKVTVTVRAVRAQADVAVGGAARVAGGAT